MRKKHLSFTKQLAGFIVLTFLFLSCRVSNKESEIPAIWSSYNRVESYDKDFADLKAHGVGALHVRNPSAEVIGAARKHNMKLITSMEEISESAYRIPQDKVERALMIGGAYKGKAIDRHRFAFSPGKHTIQIESPVYDSVDCYRTLGHYFPGMQPPVKAEIIIKKKDFDGRQHLKIVNARIGDRIDEQHWEIHFDLTGVEGDLNNVAIAVYWISEGSREYWMFGDAVSPAAQSTKDAARDAVLKNIGEWKAANGGKFPTDLIIALRFGDECFHLSGHMNCQACSYPMWDYSKSTMESYHEMTDMKCPTGKPWLDMYGRDAYAIWMYNYHQLMAGLVKVVKNTLVEEGLQNILVFRNITRYGVFNGLNDHDGTGLDILSRELDVVHLDPYPVNAGGYREEVITVDMAYAEGLARRHNKMLVPWLQAHQYWPDQGGLAHPGPEYIRKMTGQHLDFSSDAIMWLGYGKPPFSTFPLENPESWREAQKQHARFNRARINHFSPDFAVLRPYNVRALRVNGSPDDLDVFFTDVVLREAVIRNKMHYDPYEPLNLGDIPVDDLNKYEYILAETGKLSRKELGNLGDAKSEVILFIAHADEWTNEQEITGIHSIRQPDEYGSIIEGSDIKVNSYYQYDLDHSVEVIRTVNEYPVIWKKGNIYYVGCISDDASFATMILDLMLENR